MTQVKVFVLVVAIASVVSAYPLEENVGDEKVPSKVSPILAGETQRKQNETTDRQDSNSEKDTSSSSESTEPAYIEETYVEILLPSIPRLNSTDLEKILNRTANDTDYDRVKRSSDSEEVSKDSSSLDDVSAPSKGSTVPAVLYSSRKSNSESEKGDSSSSNESNEEKKKGTGNVHGSSSSEESSEEKSKPSRSSTAAPSLYQLRHLNTARNVEKRSSSSSKDSSEDKEKSSSNENSSEENTKISSNKTRAPLLYTSSSSSSRQIRETVENNNNGAANLHKDSSDAKTQQSQSTPALHRPLYSAQNFYSRPSRQTLGKHDNSESSSSNRNTKNPAIQPKLNKQAGKSDLLKNSRPSSNKDAGPALYSTHYSNVRKVRGTVDFSQKQQTSSTTEGHAVYITPKSEFKHIPQEARVSASPAAVGRSS